MLRIKMESAVLPTFFYQDAGFACRFIRILYTCRIVIFRQLCRLQVCPPGLSFVLTSFTMSITFA